MAELFLLVIIVVVLFLFFLKKGKTFALNRELNPEQKTKKVQHKKRDYLATPNEQKLYLALQKALGDRYVIHSQVSLIALVQPIDFRDNSKSWAKRMDFVITDKTTKILAVIELDDLSHLSKKRVKRDEYVNDALSGHHPLIRLSTKKFYEPESIAVALQEKANIVCNITAK